MKSQCITQCICSGFIQIIVHDVCVSVCMHPCVHVGSSQFTLIEWVDQKCEKSAGLKDNRSAIARSELAILYTHWGQPMQHQVQTTWPGVNLGYRWLVSPLGPCQLRQGHGWTIWGTSPVPFWYIISELHNFVLFYTLLYIFTYLQTVSFAIAEEGRNKDIWFERTPPVQVADDDHHECK